ASSRFTPGRGESRHWLGNHLDGISDGTRGTQDGSRIFIRPTQFLLKTHTNFTPHTPNLHIRGRRRSAVVGRGQGEMIGATARGTRRPKQSGSCVGGFTPRSRCPEGTRRVSCRRPRRTA